MSVVDYLGGTLVFLLMIGSAVGGAWLLLRRRFGGLRGAEAVTAFAILAVLGVLAVHLLPGIFGILGRGSVVVASALLLATCVLVRQGPSHELPVHAREDPAFRYSRPFAWIVVAATTLFFLSFVFDQLLVPSTSIDYTNFHLPTTVAWIQSGTMWQVDSFLPDLAPGNYPNNGDVLVLAFVLPWHNDFLAHLAIWPCYALTSVATYALALRGGATRSAAMVAGALIALVPAVAVSALGSTITDSVMLFGFAAGLLFLLRHHSSGSAADLVLAGLAFGVSFGTKWYAVYAVAITVAVWAGVRIVANRRRGETIRGSAILTGLVALVGGIWLVRNWILSANPAFPVKAEAFGFTLFDAPFDRIREEAGFTIVDYVGDWDVWWRIEDHPLVDDTVVDGILLQWWHALAAPALIALIGVVLAAGVLIVRRRVREESRGPVVVGLLSTGLIVAAYGVTPYTAGGPEGLPVLVGADSRYVVPAIVIAMAVAAWAFSALRWGSLAFCALGVTAAAHGIYWASNAELTVAGLSGSNWAVGFLIAGAVGLSWWALGPWWNRLKPHRTRAVAIVAALASLGLVLGVAGGYAVQREFNDDRYKGLDPVLDAVEQAGPGQRIGLAGVWDDTGVAPVLPAFGPRFANEVEYAGPVVEEMQRAYETRDSFAEALGRERYDLVLVGTGRPGVGTPPELEWLESAGWTQVATSDRLALYAPPS